MPARVLEFRSTAPAMRPQTAGALATAPHTKDPKVRVHRKAHYSSKVLIIMPNPVRNRESTLASHDSSDKQHTMFRIQAELADGYVETEPEGVSLKELACIYRALLSEGRDRVYSSVRTLLRLHPAH